jgi:hypothetical protein
MNIANFKELHTYIAENYFQIDNSDLVKIIQTSTGSYPLMWGEKTDLHLAELLQQLEKHQFQYGHLPMEEKPLFLGDLFDVTEA